MDVRQFRNGVSCRTRQELAGDTTNNSFLHACFFAYQSTLNITQLHCSVLNTTHFLLFGCLYNRDPWECGCLQCVPRGTGRTTKMLPQKMYKQTLIIIGATKTTTMSVIMVHRNNQATISKTNYEASYGWNLCTQTYRQCDVTSRKWEWKQLHISPEIKPSAFCWIAVFSLYSKNLSSLLINGTVLNTTRSKWQQTEGKLSTNSAKSFSKSPSHSLHLSEFTNDHPVRVTTGF